MNILITGGTGYVGSRLISRAMERDHSVTVASRKPVNFGSRWTQFDIGKSPSFQSLGSVSTVVHLAANTSSEGASEEEEVAEDPDRFLPS